MASTEEGTPLLQTLCRVCTACPNVAPHHVQRRRLLGGAAASALLAASGCAPQPRLPATADATPKATPGAIDIHHHLAPPTWLAATGERPTDPTFEWSPQRSLDDMDRAGVRSAVLSVTTPGVVLARNPESATRLARDSNDFGADLVRQHPGRFGLFAAVPMLQTDAALREIAYAMDSLRCDGVGLMTSYGDKWIGDPAFFPIMEELDRRAAVVYTHPTVANCCVNIQTTVNPAIVEFGTDTSRAIASVIVSGNAQRFRRIRWVFSHAGGTMPFLIERFLRIPGLNPAARPFVTDGVPTLLRRFYYDTAQTANRAAMLALREVVPVSQIVFGTDYPYRTTIDHVRGLGDSGVFTADELRSIERQTPLALLPRFNA